MLYLFEFVKFEFQFHIPDRSSFVISFFMLFKTFILYNHELPLLSFLFLNMIGIGYVSQYLIHDLLLFLEIPGRSCHYVLKLKNSPKNYFLLDCLLVLQKCSFCILCILFSLSVCIVSWIVQRIGRISCGCKIIIFFMLNV